MYCPECGNKIEEGARFCCECGTKIEQPDTAQATTATPQSEQSRQEEKGEYLCSCIILTNITLLSKVLNSAPEQTKQFIEQFIDIKKRSGVLYKLVDAGNYTYHKSSFFSSTKRVSLNAESSLWEYMDILMDIHKHEKTESQYLFIIGGNDVIPMPTVKHYIANDNHDDSIDTDILYAYPYGSQMLPLLENQQIFKEQQLFFVGRLPFGSDSTLNDLTNYLQRDINCSEGIPLTQAYGQCDPNWKNVSTKVADRLRPLMRNLDGRLADQYYYNRIILSPMVDAGNVTQVLDTDASLYYYNLHGGSALQVRGYAGAPRGENYTRMVLQPEHMRTANQPNVVVCEACYGARFINLDKHHSMLLSSIHNNTMSFLGSSRVAWGCVDQPNWTPQNAHISNADIIANSFIAALLEGYTTGQAMFLARSAVLKNSKAGNLLAALTVVEFNLYGDPIMFMNRTNNKAISHKQIDTSPYIKETASISCTTQEINIGKQEADSSILGAVRSAVNANIAQIHDTIANHLYKNFGLTPRPADSILKIKYSDGSEEYNFRYKSQESNSTTPLYYLVTTTPSGQISEINTSK